MYAIEVWCPTDRQEVRLEWLRIVRDLCSLEETLEIWGWSS